MLKIKERRFKGPWQQIGSHPTVAGDEREMYVGPSPNSPFDIQVMAGCQQGYLHVSAALEFALNLLEACVEMSPVLGSAHLLCITDPRGGKHLYPAVGEIIAETMGWTFRSHEGSVMLGPHSLSGFSFRIVPDTRVAQALEILKRKEVNPPGTQAREPEPTA